MSVKQEILDVTKWDRESCPRIHSNVDHLSVLAPVPVQVTVDKEIGVIGVGTQVAEPVVVRRADRWEVRDVDHPSPRVHVTDAGDAVRPWVNDRASCFLIAAGDLLPRFTRLLPWAVVVTGDEDLAPVHLGDPSKRQVLVTHRQVTDQPHFIVRVHDKIVSADEVGVHLLDGVVGTVAELDDVGVTKVVVATEPNRHQYFSMSS